MKNLIKIAVLLATLQAGAADVVYREKPDQPVITVKAGDSASMYGQTLLGDSLKLHLKFDSMQTFFTNSALQPGANYVVGFCTGAAGSIDLKASPEGKVSVATDAKHGTGAARISSDGGLYISPVPRELKGDKPFTFACWMKVDETASSSSSNQGIFGVGNATNNSANGLAFKLAGSSGNAYKQIAYGNTTKMTVSPLNQDIRESGWVHVAVTYDPNVTWRYMAYTNGVYLSASNKEMFDASGEDDVVLLCCARQNEYFRASSDVTEFDEMMVFDRVLTAEEIAWVKDHPTTSGTGFVSGWDVEEGAKVIFRGENAVTGFSGLGEVSSVGTLEVGAEESSYFAGMFSGSGDVAFTPGATRAFTFMGENKQNSGNVEIETGSVNMYSPGVNVLKEKFGDNLRANWTFDRGDWSYDWSGNGNTLKVNKRSWATDDPVTFETTGANARINTAIEHKNGNDLGMTDGTDGGNDNYLQPVAAISGFTTGQDNSYTISSWVKVAADSSNRCGFWWFDSTSASGMRFNETPSENNLMMFGAKDEYGSFNATTYLNAGESYLGGGDWHHYTLTYDNTTNPRQYRAYFDGQLVVSWNGSTTSSPKNFGSSASLRLGSGLQRSSKRSFHGWMDEIVILNRAVTDEEAEFLFNHRGGIPQQETELLSSGALTVDSGAVLNLDQANETVATLAGAGTVRLSSTARLAVTGTVGLTGTIVGLGKLELGDELSWMVETDEKGYAKAGSYTYFTVPTAMLEAYNSSGWTVTPAPRRSAADQVRVFAIDNGDGTTTFKSTVPKKGLFIVVY